MRNGIILETVLAGVVGVGFCAIFTTIAIMEGGKIIVRAVGKTLDEEMPGARYGKRPTPTPGDVCLNRMDPSTEQQ